MQVQTRAAQISDCLIIQFMTACLVDTFIVHLTLFREVSSNQHIHCSVDEAMQCVSGTCFIRCSALVLRSKWSGSSDGTIDQFKQQKPARFQFTLQTTYSTQFSPCHPLLQQAVILVLLLSKTGPVQTRSRPALGVKSVSPGRVKSI